MQIPRILTLLIIYSFFFQVTKVMGQKTRSNYQLLWKISGNGLKKSSYLFGTMHLQDRRAFDFSDSVLVKLDECTTFAMEITPDSLLQYVFMDLLEKRSDTSNNIKNLLTPEECEALNKKLKAETGLSLDQVKRKSPKAIATLLTKPIQSKNDKATFLDAYLYNLVYKQNKKIIGLEYVSEQLPLLDTREGENLKYLKWLIYNDNQKDVTENLIQSYWEGDISKIDKVMNLYEKDLDKLLYIRNVKMAERMTKYMHDSSTFVAVGAGHLPGEKGLINLLKNKGYTVTPVPATFTGLAARYKEKQIEGQWYKHYSEEDAYTLEFPFKPFLYKKGMEDKGINFYLYPDIATGIFYYSMSLLIPSVPSGSEDKILNRFIEGMSKEGSVKILSNKGTNYNGYPSREFESYNSVEKIYSKTKVILKKNRLYMVMLGSNKRELTHSKESSRFFDSFHFLTFKNPNWEIYTSEEGAFEISTPFKMSKIKEKNVKQEDAAVSIGIFTASDPNTGIEYIAGYNTLSPGFIIQNDSIFLTTSLNGMIEKQKAELIYSKEIQFENFPGKEFSLKTRNNLSFKGRLFIRGTRLYMAFAGGSTDKIDSKDISDYIESFKFRKYMPDEYSSYTSKELGFTIDVPSEVSKSTDSSTYSLVKQYADILSFQEKPSGCSYSVIVTHFPKYYYINESEFYEKPSKQLIDDADSILHEKVIMADGIKGKELIVKVQGNHAQKRIICLPKGNRLYEMFAYIPEKYIDLPETNRFYSSFHFTDKSKETEIFKSKTKQLLNDLSSKDSTTRSDAFNYLTYYNYSNKDLDDIYKALKKSYADDTSGTGSTRETLFLVLNQFNDTSTSGFISYIYPTLASTPDLQLASLRTLLYCKSENSYALFEKLIRNEIPKVKSVPYNFLSPLRDSLELNKILLPKLFFLTSEFAFREDLLDLGKILIDSNKISPDFFSPYKSSLIEHVRKDLKALDSTDIYNWRLYNSINSAIQLLSKLPPDSGFINFLTTLSNSKNVNLSFIASKKLLENKASVAETNLTRIAGDPDFRIDLYEFLSKEDKLKLFPSKFLKQEYFAEAHFRNYLNYEQETFPDSLVLLQAKTARYEGKEGRFYLYKFLIKSEEGNEWYTGISGPMPMDKTKMISEGAATKSWYEPLKNKSLSQHFQSLLNEAPPLSVK